MRVAWVVPRYGPEIGGGAEELCRQTVELLKNDVESTVLTTCALDYQTWANYHRPGETSVNGVRVLRFPVARERDLKEFGALSQAVFLRPTSRPLAVRWMREQGPDAPGLVQYLRARCRTYDAVCFVPYLYATTAHGLPVVADRAVLAPCAHDEPPLRLAIFDDVFAAAQVLVYNTREERELVERRFGRGAQPSFVGGFAVAPSPPSDPHRFRKRYDVEGPYLLCVGRIEPAKGSHDLIERFREARQRRPELRLVLVGRPHMEIPDVPGLVVTGFVDEQTKHDALSGAVVVALPSPYESLSIAALEAWSHGRPTLANAVSDVLRAQTARSSGGLWYHDAAEFHEALDLLLSHPPLAETLGRQGQSWIRANVDPALVRRTWLEALETAASAAARPPLLVSPER